MNNTYIDIKRIAEIKGLKSTRSIRIAIQKGKYIAREIKVNGVIWTALNENESEPINENEKVVIVAVRGNKLVVRKEGK